MTSEPPSLKNSADLGDSEKWPKLHWVGDRPSPHGGAYVYQHHV